MKIEISTTYGTSYTGHHRVMITAKILNDVGTLLCDDKSEDSWPDPKQFPASAKGATKNALDKFALLLKNTKDVAKKSGLL